MAYTPGPWAYIPSNENHGPYVVNDGGAGDICDCYTMSNLSDRSVINGGESKPIHFQYEEADANARLIAAAPDMLAALNLIDAYLYATAPESNERQIVQRAIAKAEGK